MARLFFAVCVCPAVATAMHRLQERLRAAVRGAKLSWSDMAQAHCTLKFLGEVDESRFEPLRAAGQRVSTLVEPFDVTLHGVGAFPDVRRPRVVWLGVKRGAAELGTLAAALDRELVPAGFSPEDRAFTAHLTLARIKFDSAMAPASRAIAGCAQEPVATWQVAGFSLMRSSATPQGVRYSSVYEFALNGSRGSP